MDISIQLKKVNKSFSNKVLFADLSYTFQQQVYHIIGKNGAGKSTLLRLIVGLYFPDSGSIVLNNKYSVSDNSANAKRLYYVPDDLAIYPFLTGKEFLSWLAKERTKNVHEINELIGQPDFIILDEPLNGLDKKSQQVLLTLLQEKTSHCGILLTTHHDANLNLLNPIKTDVLGHRLVDLHE